jgi:hypothetical protein
MERFPAVHPQTPPRIAQDAPGAIGVRSAGKIPHPLRPAPRAAAWPARRGLAGRRGQWLAGSDPGVHSEVLQAPGPRFHATTAGLWRQTGLGRCRLADRPGPTPPATPLHARAGGAMVPAPSLSPATLPLMNGNITPRG